ncbi:MAG: porin family protein [Ignavibacterium album]|uniref:Outer membrane protein beta-barrel domain-containing protein n=1 Tax=Ignavibacterium album TaxID=591197 RepID=A0A7V2ZHG0_9BACT|nr:outer membrane beta-barrel protein [Ignavibacterium album]MCX8104378.1 porin family protein [Ignavibacterium album]
MKKLLLVLFVTVLAVAFTNAQSKMGVSVQGGVFLPTGDFGDAAATGFGGTGTFTYNVTPMLQVTGSIGYATWGPKEDLPSGWEWSFSSIPVQVGLRYAFGKGNFLPYVAAETGMHFLSSKVTFEMFGQTYTSDDSESKFGFAPGAGFLYNFNPKTALDVTLKYNMIFTEGSSTTYLGINAGVAFAL